MRIELPERAVEIASALNDYRNARSRLCKLAENSPVSGKAVANTDFPRILELELAQMTAEAMKGAAK